MSEHRSKVEEWREAARRKARELDEKYNIRERAQDGARAAQQAAEAARRGAERVAETAEETARRARTEAERLTDEYEVGDHARRAAEEATKRAREAGEAFRHAGRTAEKRAGEVFDEAKNYYDRAARMADMGARLTRASAFTTSAVLRAGNWARENPKQAALVSFSLVAGVRLGSAFPKIDGVLLGSHPHWFTHSAVPVWALQKVGSKFDAYLRDRERLVAEGELTEAEERRAEFERQAVRYVGAPLLGAFSCATGVALWAQIFQPGRITGAPVSWLLGGNPFLDGVWLFANGVVCFQQGYKFFMIALKDQRDVERVVRELKGLLPAAASV